MGSISVAEALARSRVMGYWETVPMPFISESSLVRSTAGVSGLAAALVASPTHFVTIIASCTSYNVMSLYEPEEPAIIDLLLPPRCPGTSEPAVGPASADPFHSSSSHPCAALLPLLGPSCLPLS